MRSVPWRWIDGSTRPSALTRLLDDLDRLIDHLPDALEQRRLGRGSAARGRRPTLLDVERALAGAAEEAARAAATIRAAWRALLQIVVAKMTSTELPRITGARVQTDARLAQDPADIVLQGLELLPAHVVGVDLEQDVRAALQVETEHDVALRPCGPALDSALREEVGNRQQADRSMP